MIFLCSRNLLNLHEKSECRTECVLVFRNRTIAETDSQTEFHSGKTRSIFPKVLDTDVHTQTHTHTLVPHSLWPHYSTDIWRRAVHHLTQIYDSNASWKIQ